ncbi:MAG: hypothetical protein OEX10_06285 [Candidatus Bathyarchaeota archaeon]|nr:hypothetical protein [Candidatus Bathyarchaeota archaeon]
MLRITQPAISKMPRVKLSGFFRKLAKKSMLNKMQKLKLSSKIRMVANPQKVVKASERRLRFYTKYADFVLKTLKKPLFQKFLNWVIKRENIEGHMVKNIQVRVFPFQKENGKRLAGRWNSKGEILIYPKRLDFFRRMMRNGKKETVYFYIKCRAMATLIHELLHVKYLDDENNVRELTRKYFNIFIQRQNTQNSNSCSIQKMLFPT